MRFHRKFLPALALAIALASSAPAQNVLAYTGSLWMGLQKYSSYGSLTVTMADDATWMSMSTAQFAAFDFIWIGDWQGAYAAPFATQATWGPAITGHVVVAGLDTQAHSQPGVTTFVNDVVGWLIAGSGTSLFVGTDVGTRGLDFLSFIPITGCVSFNCFNQDTVIPTMPAHPTMLNSTQASLSNWGQSTHNRILTFPAGWEVVATGPGGEAVVVVSPNVTPPSCSLLSPGATVRDDVSLTVDSSSPNSMTVDVTLEFSTDGGATYLLATMSPASPNPNPAAALALGPQGFVWDSRGDGVGLALVAPVTMRATIADGFAMGFCTATFDVDNTLICNGICGDCNLNALGPDILDALAAAQIAAGLFVPSPTQAACCDVNISGTVDILDALLIAKEAAGLVVTLMCI